MIDLYSFKKDIIDNKWVKFNVKTRDSFNKLENALLKYGCRWRSSDYNVKLSFGYKAFGENCIVHINFCGDEPKILSYDDCCNMDDYKILKIEDDNIDYVLFKLFNNEPNYNSKKIYRTI